MKYLYSASTNSFYPSELVDVYKAANSFPEDTIDVDDGVYIEFSASAAPVGKVRAAGKKGMPVWVNLPAPTPEEIAEEKAVLIAQTKLKKSKLMTEASNKIDVLRDRIDAGQDKEAELKLWKVYRIELDDVDVSDPVWPVSPE
ncbi:TPA: tail fiber assembly protein [Yersinia enterocolitica]|uniref:tail fiber assembly protein n=1 Tax=Yersinia enterocolitica TaxID=630 RepID=UPI0005FCF8C5|nr:tail fiber assembly protein [Yersinia enterocolitica]EKN3879766.1 tail fiber assembly protein [Yersinia enterocolitica]EKN5930794.1 tail fiber assembly protein [Yersinia enterocolitica]ELI7991192.1 tail fiber assembly protein [Yersinia enterocolitica]ELW7356617.1 tail fiber assembly protein [Yersinia enterocolitica]ELX2281729.1 tail fiber assembly protein [Yersinia enterocolitica]